MGGAIIYFFFPGPKPEWGAFWGILAWSLGKGLGGFFFFFPRFWFYFWGWDWRFFWWGQKMGFFHLNRGPGTPGVFFGRPHQTPLQKKKPPPGGGGGFICLFWGLLPQKKRGLFFFPCQIFREIFFVFLFCPFGWAPRGKSKGVGTFFILWGAASFFFLPPRRGRLFFFFLLSWFQKNFWFFFDFF